MFVCSECGLSSPSPGGCPADGTQLFAIGEDLLLGQTVGAYRIARLLGVGGMGRVYKGVHPTIGSRVAIKVLSRECSDRRELVDRFFAEARAVNVIRHESIVNVLDLSMLPDGRPFIIMEFLDGAPLSTILEMANARGSRLPIGGTARVCGEVLDALQAAHDKGVIHRDLKPDNIFVAPSGRPKVLDFGIAKLSDTGVTSSTKTGSLLGTPHYMSPEQAQGKAADPRADLYAMGVILFECMTGQKPFVSESLFQLLRMQLEETPVSPRTLRPDLPLEIEQIILCAMAKAPDQRFNSARAMNQALQHATQSLPAHEWLPVMGGMDLASTLPRAWEPTPPRSWGNGSSPSAAPLSSPSGAPLTERQNAHATPTPGQLPNARVLHGERFVEANKPSKAGLFFALGAVALAVGGIVVAVVVSSGKNNKAESGQPAQAPTVEAKAGTNDGAQTNDAAKAADNGRANDTDKDDKDDNDDLTALTQLAAGGGDGQDAALDEGIDQVVAAVRQQAKLMPPEVMKLVDELEAAKKLPTAEKMKKLQEFSEKISAIMQKPSGVVVKKAQQLAEADDPPNANGGLTARGWFNRHVLSPPFKTNQIDVTKFIAWSLAEAKKNVPDAELTRVDVENVNAKGIVDLTLPTDGGGRTTLLLRFYSPSWKKRNPSTLPKGIAGNKKECQFYILAAADETEIYDVSRDCKDEAIAPPKCSVAQVWQKVIAKKPEVADYVGSVGYWGNDGKGRWHVDIEDDDKDLFSDWVADDCK